MGFGTVNVGAPRGNDGQYLKTEQMGAPGGVATLDSNGKLAEGQRWEVDAYKKSEADVVVATAVNDHNSSAQAHPLLQAVLADLETSVRALELKYGTQIKDNPFQVTFSSLDGATVSGVWNTAQAQIEF